MQKNIASIVEDFKGESVVLLSLDNFGLVYYLDALALVKKKSVGESVHVDKFGIPNTFVIHENISTIAFLENSCVNWSMAACKFSEILEKLDSMRSYNACHHYVEIDAPVRTFVLSLNEYD